LIERIMADAERVIRSRLIGLLGSTEVDRAALAVA
jgi:hypothetical protein